MTMRRESLEVNVGNIGIGGDNPIRIQSMTNTPTQDADATAKQIMDLADAGSEIARITVMDNSNAEAVPKIKSILEKEKYAVPLIGDFHFNGHLLLARYPEMAQILDKYRINPGNVGFGDKRDPNFKAIIEKALDNRKPVRIGVNFGSIDQKVYMKLMDENSKKPGKEQKDSEELAAEAMVISALESARLAREYGMPENRIILSAKVSRMAPMVRAYQEIASKTRYPLHLGLTEAGLGTKGIDALSHNSENRGSESRPADPPIKWSPPVPSHRDELPGMRPNNINLIPGNRPGDYRIPPKKISRVEKRRKERV